MLYGSNGKPYVGSDGSKAIAAGESEQKRRDFLASRREANFVQAPAETSAA